MHSAWIPIFLGLLFLTSGCGSSSSSGAPGSGGAPGPGAAPGTVVQLSTDPFTDSIAQHATAVEPSMLAQGSTIVSAFQVGRISSGASDAIGWATSSNGGASWSRGFVPGLTSAAGGSNLEVTDAVVAYDAAHGVWLIESLVFPNSGSSSSVVVNRASDGVSWGQPVAVASGTQDKCWIACDNGASSPHRGTCYAEWDDISTNVISLSASTDGGLTWSAPVGTGDSSSGIAGQFAILSNGNVVMPFFNGSTSSPQLLQSTSTNGGASWSNSIVIGTPQTTSIPTRGETDPQVTVQPNGTIDVAWFDCRFESGCAANDIVRIQSTDGASWSSPARLAVDPVGSGLNHFLPTIAANPSSSGIGLLYYTASAGCSGASCQATPWFSHSSDGGQTWSTPSALSSSFALSEVATAPEGPMLGDYFAIGFVGGTAFPAYSAPVQPGSTTLNQQIFTVAIPGV